MTKPTYVRWFADISYADVPLVGGKNASLGEMYRELTPLGVRQANGFALTAAAFRDALSAAGAWDRLHAELDPLDKTDTKALARAGARCRQIVYAAGLPEGARAEVLEAYRRLEQEYGEDLSVAVRSSATAEDLPTASFAGQHETYLNIRGEELVLDAIRRCNASLFTDRAISYRIDQGFDHFQVALSACVQKMVRSDLASSGVIFSIDTETGFADAVFITGAWGLGENVVQGAVDPDEFYVHKPTFRQGHRAVLRRTLGAKKVKMVYAEGRSREPVLNKPTSREERERFCLADDQVLTLADDALKIEDHYRRRAGRLVPMDIEWALDGLDGELYIVQARPETVASQRQASVLEEYVIEGHGKALASGRAVGTRCAQGRVRVVKDARHLSEFRPGEVLVADTTTPDWEPVMKTAAAIVTNLLPIGYTIVAWRRLRRPFGPGERILSPGAPGILPTDPGGRADAWKFGSVRDPYIQPTPAAKSAPGSRDPPGGPRRPSLSFACSAEHTSASSDLRVLGAFPPSAVLFRP
jgi:pyruvate,water dikinase